MSPPAAPLPGLDLAGRRALVTGAGGGIGAACARRLADAGVRVVAVDLPGREGPAGCETWACDVSDPAAVRALADGVKKGPGGLEILVHAAGITRDAPLWRMEDADWARVLDVNLGSGFLLLKAFAPILKEAGDRGAAVLVASVNGQRGKAGQANYAASKAGLMALGKTAAIEWGRFGVRVNCVAPGWIETAMTAGLPEDLRRRAVEESALKRTGTADDVAGVVLFLASGLARHVTGQVLRVDGGQLTA